MGAGAVMDVRFGQASPWHFRIVGELSYKDHEDALVGRGSRHGGGFALRLRVFPFAVDLGDYIAFRVGVEIGAQLVDPSFEAAGALLTELGVRLFDGRLELGLTAGVLQSPYRIVFGSGEEVSSSIQFLLAGHAGYLFL